MRKYKQVKEKKITFDMKQWAEVKRRLTPATRLQLHLFGTGL